MRPFCASFVCAFITQMFSVSLYLARYVGAKCRKYLLCVRFPLKMGNRRLVMYKLCGLSGRNTYIAFKKMEWSNELTLEFIGLYELEPIIWDPKNPQHKNRNSVADAWRRISSSMSKKYAITELKKKKDSLMSIFRPLCLKEKASLKSGAGTDDVYKPNWFCYQAMAKFLRGVYQPRTSINTEVLDEDSNLSLENQEPEQPTENEIPSPGPSFKLPSDRAAKKRKGLSTETIEKRMEDAYNILKTTSGKGQKDALALYGELLVAKLRAFDDDTREILMNEIDNLVFRTKMNKKPQQRLTASVPSSSLVYSLSSPYSPDSYCSHSSENSSYYQPSPDASASLHSQNMPASSILQNSSYSHEGGNQNPS